MSKRRTRYTYFITGREPGVALAYDGPGAANAVARHFGIDPSQVRVTKGDLRKQAKSRSVQAQGGFQLDPKAVRQAQGILGLKWKVDIRHHARVGDTNGNYQLKPQLGGVPSHNIMLKSYLTPEQATKTLWHELTHAMQAERAGGVAEWERVRNDNGRYSYKCRPIEIEARDMSDKMSVLYPLTK